jgi:hypothetical protein
VEAGARDRTSGLRANIRSVTAQGHPSTRFDRALKTRNLGIIIPAALELPRPIQLRDGVRVLLAIRDLDPGRYPPAAARFGATVTTRHRLAIADAQLVIAALAAMGSDSPVAGGEVLVSLLEAHDEHQAAAFLSQWLSAWER